jgi:chromosomal replication initiation ATPase DnaA
VLIPKIEYDAYRSAIEVQRQQRLAEELFRDFVGYFVTALEARLEEAESLAAVGFDEAEKVLRIQEQVCVDRSFYGTPMRPLHLISRIKDRPVILARHFAMWRCKVELQLSTTTIGRAFGGRDHTTVIHALSQVEKARRQDDPRWRSYSNRPEEG